MKAAQIIRHPYGYRIAPAGRIVPDAVEQDVLREIMALGGAGLSLRAISGTLAAREDSPGMGGHSPP